MKMTVRVLTKKMQDCLVRMNSLGEKIKDGDVLTNDHAKEQ